MELVIQVNGRMVNMKEKVDLSILMEKIILEIGRLRKNMAVEYIYGSVEVNLKVNIS